MKDHSDLEGVELQEAARRGEHCLIKASEAIEALRGYGVPPELVHQLVTDEYSGNGWGQAPAKMYPYIHDTVRARLAALQGAAV